MITDLCGVESVKAAIMASPHFAWRVTEIKPIFSDSGYLKTTAIFDASNADNHQEAAQRFEDWSNMILSGNPNNNKVYYLTLFEQVPDNVGRKKKIEPIVFSFSLNSPYTHSANSFPAGGHRQAPQAPQAAPAAPVQDFTVLLELERLRWENEQLRASIIDDLESDDDEEEDDDEGGGNVFESFFSGVVNAPATGQTEMQKTVSEIITSFAHKLTNTVSPEIEALNSIKAAAPDADKLIIQLGVIAKNNPDQIKQFVSELLTTFQNGSTEKSSESSTTK